MKHFTKLLQFFFFFSFILVLNVYSQGFTSVFSKNGTDVIAVGGNTIFRSANGGASWTSKQVSGSSFHSVWAIGSKIWITNQNGDSVYTSTDNGVTWNSYSVGITKISGIDFLNGNTGWVTGKNAIAKTTNGGVNWSAQTVPVSDTYTSVKFTDPGPLSTILNGVACASGGALIYTTNGGTNWHTADNPSLIPNKELVSIDIDGTTAIATGDDAFILKSTDAGASWNYIDYRILTRSRVWGVNIRDQNTFYTCGGGGFIRKSTDGGNSFSFQQNPMLANLTAIYFYDNQNGWAVSSKNQAVLRTTDGGSHWLLPTGTTVSISFSNKLNTTGNVGNGFVRHPKNKNGIFVACGDTVYRSLNLGDNWTKIATIPSRFSRNVIHTFYVSQADTNIFLASIGEADGKVLKSTNYGVTWDSVWGGTLTTYGVPFIMDPNHAGIYYLAPNSSKMFRTTNYGNTWSSRGNHSFTAPCDFIIAYGNSNLMFLGDQQSDSTRFYQSTDNGIHWESLKSLAVNTEIPMIGFNNLDTNRIFFTDFGGPGFWRSTNAGNNWSLIGTDFSTWGTDVAKDDPTVVAYGTYGAYMYISTNGGNSFDSLNITADNVNLADYFYDRGTLLLEQSGGIWKLSVNYDVLSTTSPLAVKQLLGNVPKEFALSQNYPNPFNPATRIKFDVPSGGALQELPVRLVVYDALGREAVTLIDEQLKPGSYQVEWDASNFSSGIYFYKLVTKDFNVTKKMILIK